MKELMAEIAEVNEPINATVPLVTPLMPGEAHDLDEAH